MQPPQTDRVSVNPSALLSQVSDIVRHSRHDSSLGHVHVAELKLGACSTVANWVKHADIESINACFDCSTARLHDLLDSALHSSLGWFLLGPIGFYLLEGYWPITFFGFAWIGWLFVMDYRKPNPELLRELSSIIEDCAIELTARNPSWDPFSTNLGPIRRRRLRKLSWVFRKFPIAPPPPSTP